MSSEKTPLTSNSAARAALSYPYYGNDTGVHPFYTRRRKEQQLQCITFVIVIAVFIMTLVIAVSYSINEAVDPLVADSTNPEEVPPPPSLKSTGRLTPPNLGISNEITSTLSTAEWNEAIKAGEEAIASREAADALATPLPAPSPDSRHQYAVKTSLQAGKLALAGIGELAATRNIEASRTKLGTPSSIGSYFKNIWAPEGTCREFSKIACPPSKYRNFDGTCNHPRHYGSALTPFMRKLPPAYADGVEAPRVGKFGTSLPSAREISLKVHPPSPSSNPSFTVMLAVFGQFLDHDITATALSQGTNGTSLTCCPADTHQHPECFPVQVGTGDPVYDLAGRTCMEFVRSAPAPQCKIGPRQQLNQVTSFIDGSVIYGPDVATAQSLREGQGGLLRMFITPDNRTLLPQSTDPNDGCNREVESIRGRYCFASGDGRANENLHLTTMHLLWARQHNRIAKLLSEVNPTWSDEKIYQETRRIIGAQLQHITYEEFVPTIIGEKEAALHKLKPLTSGFRPRNNSMDVNPAIANSFAAAAFRFAHTLLPGLMKVTDAQKSTSSYVELHRMLFNPYSLYSKGGMESSLTMATSNPIQKTTTHVTSQLTKHLFEDPLSNATTATIPCGLDLVSLNIQRGRDHGLAGYTAWRQYCGLGKVNSFAELHGELDPEALDQISKLYAHVDDVDLYTGALAEIDKADGLVGPTFRCLIRDQFTRIQEGDRFWYEVPGEPQSFTQAQLTEIRKTSLAKLICDCSDEINEIQPLVMRSVSSENPMTSCEDIPDPDLTAWKDPSSTVLKATAPEIPATWINFKEEINKTVQGIIDYFGKAPPAPASPDWLTFKNWVNNSFADIRSEIATIYPKPVVAANSPTFDTKKDTFKQTSKFPGSEFNTKADGGVKQFGKFNYMQFVMNKSLTDLNKYSKTATTQSTTYDDWITFKNDIKTLLDDALTNATGMPTADQREELKKQIAAEIEEIKSGIASMNSIKLSLIKGTAFDDFAGSSDWLSFKGDVIKAVTEAVDRIKDKSPPPGDPAWATFGLEIKNQFAGIKNYIPVLPPQKLMADDPSAAAYWDNFRNSLNKSINNAVADIDGKMPAPGDPAWADFGANIKDQFAGFNTYPNLQAKDPSVKPSKPKNPAFAAYWDNFKDSLNKSISNAVADIAAKSPPPGDPAWAEFGAKIMNDFSAFKAKIPGSKKQPGLQMKETIKDPAIDAFWDDFRSSLNSTIDSAVSDIAGKSPPPGDPAWADFGAKIMNNFAGFKDKFATFNGANGKIKEKATGPGKVVPFDWYTFKSDIIKSVDDIAAKGPPPGDPAWAKFGAKIMNDFSAFKAKISKSKKQPGLQMKETIKDPAIDAFWDDFRTSLNSTIDAAVSDITGKSPPPGDPAWADFGAKIMNNFAGFKDKFAAFYGTNGKIKEKATGAGKMVPFDWYTFKMDIIKSVADTVKTIKKNMPPPGSPAWAAFKGQVMTGFAKIPSESPSLKLSGVQMPPEDGPKPTNKPGTFDWLSFKNEINKSVSEIIDNKATAGKFPPGDPKWADFGAKFAKFNTSFDSIKSEIDKLRPKPEESQFAVLKQDWMDFKMKINKSLANTIDMIKSKAPAPGDPGWTTFRDSIKDEFAALKNEINFVKSEISLKSSGKAARTIVSLSGSKDTVRETQNVPDFSSDLFSLQARANKTLLQLKKNIADMKLGATVPVISAADWIAFKQEINDAVANYVNSFNGTEAEEWKNMKDLVKTSFAGLRNEIIALRNKTIAFQEISKIANPDLRLQAKKPKDGEISKTPFDWETLKNDVNLTVQTLLDDIEKIKPNKNPTKNLKDSLMNAQSKFANLQMSPSSSLESELPTDWAVFVNGINKTLNGVMKKIGALKPVDVEDSVALKNYEKEVDAFFDEVKDVVDKKKTEFEALTSIGNSISSVFRTVTMILPLSIILIIV